MIEPVERLIAAFWAHPTHGISALAQTIPRTRIGTSDVDAAPPLINVFGAADHEGVAKSMRPPETPAWIVWGDSVADIEVKGVGQCKGVTIVGAYVTDDGADEATANRNCGYFMRAAMLSMDRYGSQAMSAELRELAGIRILGVGDFQEQRVTGSDGTTKLWGLFTVRAAAADTLGGRRTNRGAS